MYHVLKIFKCFYWMTVIILRKLLLTLYLQQLYYNIENSNKEGEVSQQ